MRITFVLILHTVLQAYTESLDRNRIANDDNFMDEVVERLISNMIDRVFKVTVARRNSVLRQGSLPNDIAMRQAGILATAVPQAMSMRTFVHSPRIRVLARGRIFKDEPDDYDLPAFRKLGLDTDTYVDRLEEKFDAARGELTDLVAKKEYKQASEALVNDPFDTVCQQCFFLPIAMERIGDPMAKAMKGLWFDVKKTGEAFDKTMIAAASRKATDKEAAQALVTFLMALDKYRVIAQDSKR
eukprot:gnl/MRDRNA2_/MRDRNA2_158881_c0_seq1.p1 gnl/MRDRNA2_/MRDRNA2_158881_c0~~gnl/MRDRNA2_/MRDRNA2_158881_c0_seq1.p1  ORF type:complete len:242 (-),score=51.11 gnl/MRDRNA2_/MRDRNA2_158881_c0_seq1:33-758(-)